MTPSLRHYWLVMHRWLGLTIGSLFAVLGLTGSILVFDHAIDEWLNPKLLLTTQSGRPAALQTVLDTAELARGERALSVTKPRVPQGVWTVWFAGGTAASPTFTAVHVDPFTAHITGQRIWGDDLLSWIYRLHFRLLGGKIGAVIAGLTGVIMLISIASGLLLWWPLWKRSYRAALALRFDARLNFDVHKLVGFGTAGFLIVIAFTGVTMEFHEWFVAAAKSVSEVTAEPDHVRSVVVPETDPLTADAAIQLAQQQFPNAAFDHLHPPTDEYGVYEVAFRQSDEVQQSFGRSQVFLDQYSGDVLAIRRPQNFTAADAFFAWQFPLHNGEALGLPGRWFVFCLGVAPTVLYVTGLILWLRRRRSARKAAAAG